MLVYRFGSLSMSWYIEQLAVPALRWIGIHPKDFAHLNTTQLSPLTERDRSRLEAICTRDYMDHSSNVLIREQLEEMDRMGTKAEIQSVKQGGLASYLLDKVSRMEWI